MRKPKNTEIPYAWYWKGKSLRTGLSQGDIIGPVCTGFDILSRSPPEPLCYPPHGSGCLSNTCRNANHLSGHISDLDSQQERHRIVHEQCSHYQHHDYESNLHQTPLCSCLNSGGGCHAPAICYLSSQHHPVNPPHCQGCYCPCFASCVMDHPPTHEAVVPQHISPAAGSSCHCSSETPLVSSQCGHLQNNSRSDMRYYESMTGEINQYPTHVGQRHRSIPSHERYRHVDISEDSFVRKSLYSTETSSETDQQTDIETRSYHRPRPRQHHEPHPRRPIQYTPGRE